MIEWFEETERAIGDAEPLTSDPDTLRSQLAQHKALSDDVTQQRAKARDVMAAIKRLRRESGDEDPLMTTKSETLAAASDSASKMAAERLASLEQALPLSEHFHATHADIETWFEDIEADVTNLERAPALDGEQIKEQQEETRRLQQVVGDQKPLFDRLAKTGAALSKLLSDEDGEHVTEIVDADTQRYNEIKMAARERAQVLEDALHHTAEVCTS